MFKATHNMISSSSSTTTTATTGWWFGTFFIFPYIGNNNPNSLSYFSEGLKPPTRRSSSTSASFSEAPTHPYHPLHIADQTFRSPATQTPRKSRRGTRPSSAAGAWPFAKNAGAWSLEKSERSISAGFS
jgi:hypothetical protein